jgi:hypothetical protein
MNLFWDTSALLGLIFLEPSSFAATEAWHKSDADYAWRWLAVEASAGLSRRRATPSQWKMLDDILGCVHFADLSPQDMSSLCRFNREWALRAADAGHLFVFKQLSILLPDIEMICFDREVSAVAQKLRLPLWGDADKGHTGQLREGRASYGRGKRSVGPHAHSPKRPGRLS